MTEPRKWEDYQGFRLYQWILHEHYKSLGGPQPVQLHTRTRVKTWDMDFIFAGLAGDLSPRKDGEETFTMHVMMLPVSDDSWSVVGKILVTWPAFKHFLPTTYENDSFKVVGQGSTLDDAMMRAKLAGMVMEKR